MPLPPITITDSQRDVLLAWLGAGAPAVSPQTCVVDAGTDSTVIDASAPDVSDASDTAADTPDANDSDATDTVGDAADETQ